VKEVGIGVGVGLGGGVSVGFGAADVLKTGYPFASAETWVQPAGGPPPVAQ
jgi:hypothetical protein